MKYFDSVSPEEALRLWNEVVNENLNIQSPLVSEIDELLNIPAVYCSDPPSILVDPKNLSPEYQDSFFCSNIAS